MNATNDDSTAPPRAGSCAVATLRGGLGQKGMASVK